MYHPSSIPGVSSKATVIERAQVLNTSKDLSPDITVAFDDTPGLENSTFEDRELNASLLIRYEVNHFTNIHPNVIVLQAATRMITRAENDNIGIDVGEMVDFISEDEGGIQLPILKCIISKPRSDIKGNNIKSTVSPTSIPMLSFWLQPGSPLLRMRTTKLLILYALHRSNLVDEKRANVVIMVTKSLPFFIQFDDYKTMKEKRAMVHLGRDTQGNYHRSPAENVRQIACARATEKASTILEESRPAIKILLVAQENNPPDIGIGRTAIFSVGKQARGAENAGVTVLPSHLQPPLDFIESWRCSGCMKNLEHATFRQVTIHKLDLCFGRLSFVKNGSSLSRNHRRVMGC
ncbi:hypothetical protein B0H14DRAFT_2570644 [Mycena olivaceomarginata]|nr:hypothetical protein B0H14DRAFT_2570644 [Mycena olivaceomarginata]